MSDKIIKNWIALAHYDLDTAGAMLETGSRQLFLTILELLTNRSELTAFRALHR